MTVLESKPKTITITINGKAYQVAKGSALTGTQLKALGNVPAGETLFLEHGDDDRDDEDQRIDNDREVHLRGGPMPRVRSRRRRLVTVEETTTETLFEAEVAAVAVSFPGSLIVPEPGHRLVRIPALPMRAPWSPSTVRGLLVCANWPAQRPQLLVGDELRRDGAAPANFAPQYAADEAWFSYSFGAAYDPSHPALVPVIRGWLKRFDGRSD